MPPLPAGLRVLPPVLLNPPAQTFHKAETRFFRDLHLGLPVPGHYTPNGSQRNAETRGWRATIRGGVLHDAPLQQTSGAEDQRYSNPSARSNLPVNGTAPRRAVSAPLVPTNTAVTGNAGRGLFTRRVWRPGGRFPADSSAESSGRALSIMIAGLAELGVEDRPARGSLIQAPFPSAACLSTPGCPRPGDAAL